VLARLSMRGTPCAAVHHFLRQFERAHLARDGRYL
jgi:hypothetical protein